MITQSLKLRTGTARRKRAVSAQFALSSALWPQQVMSEQHCKDQVPDAEQKRHLEQKARREKNKHAHGKRSVLDYCSVGEHRTIPPVIPPDRNVRSSEQHGRAANKPSKQSWIAVVEVVT